MVKHKNTLIYSYTDSFIHTNTHTHSCHSATTPHSLTPKITHSLTPLSLTFTQQFHPLIIHPHLHSSTHSNLHSHPKVNPFTHYTFKNTLALEFIQYTYTHTYTFILILIPTFASLHTTPLLTLLIHHMTLPQHITTPLWSSHITLPHQLHSHGHHNFTIPHLHLHFQAPSKCLLLLLRFHITLHGHTLAIKTCTHSSVKLFLFHAKLLQPLQPSILSVVR